MALRLQTTHLDEIRRHAQREYPAECCGILVGNAAGDTKDVTEVAPIENLRNDPARAQDLVPLADPSRESERNRFLIDPKEQLRVEKDAREHGLSVVGYYHSHPDHPAQPSGYDRDHAWPWYSYVIVSVVSGRAGDTRSWVLKDERDRFEAEVLEISDRSAPAAKNQEPVAVK